MNPWRVFLVAQFQKQILGSTAVEGLIVRGAQMAPPRIPLETSNRSLHVCSRTNVDKQIRPQVRATL